MTHNSQVMDDMSSKQSMDASGRESESDSIHTFRINISDETLIDLNKRVMATRWPDKETVSDQSQGVQTCDDEGASALLGNGPHLAEN